MLVKASLRLEAAQRPQWPRLYLLSRPRSRGRMPSLVGIGGQESPSLGPYSYVSPDCSALPSVQLEWFKFNVYTFAII